MGLKGRPEKSVGKCHFKLRKIQKSEDVFDTSTESEITDALYLFVVC
jgi:hypothetical protein